MGHKRGEDHKQKPAEVKPAQEAMMIVMDSISESAGGDAKSNNQLHVGQ